MKIRDAILSYAKKPEKLRSLDAVNFRSLITELLAGMGWEVSFQLPLHDNYTDIIGVTRDATGLQTSWLVVNRYYADDKSIDADGVRTILKFKDFIGISKVVLVSTSTFSRDIELLSYSRDDLHLVDLRRLADWLKNYMPLAKSSYTLSKSFPSYFLSYSIIDSVFIRHLVHRLKRLGMYVWFAPVDTLSEETEIEAIVKTVVATFDRHLGVITQESVKSEWMKTLLSSTVSYGKKKKSLIFFPISISEIEAFRTMIATYADPGLELGKKFESQQIFDFSDWKNPDSLNKQAAAMMETIESRKSEQLKDNRILTLQKQMKSDRPGDRLIAIKELGKMGKEAKTFVPLLREALKDKNLAVRSASVWALGEIGTKEAWDAIEEYENQ